MQLPFELSTAQELKAHIAKRFKRLRVEFKNITQKALAKKAGISEGTVARFEKLGEISLGNLILLAKALGAESEFMGLFPEPAEQDIQAVKDKLERPTRLRSRGHD